MPESLQTKFLQFVKELRKDVKVPLVFMTYANVVFSYGVERFVSECRESEIDGLILPDLPFEGKKKNFIHCVNNMA